VRELAVTLLRVWVIRHGVIAASRGGKMKTVAQSLAIFLYLLPVSGLLATARWWVMAAAVVLTVATGIDYVYRALALRRTSARAMRQAEARRAARAVPAPGTDPEPRPDTTAA
jgi:CDP-diacylglycerol---glycerol-3-phosphate 3-phosphatidyltransferase